MTLYCEAGADFRAVEPNAHAPALALALDSGELPAAGRAILQSAV